MRHGDPFNKINSTSTQKYIDGDEARDVELKEKEDEIDLLRKQLEEKVCGSLFGFVKCDKSHTRMIPFSRKNKIRKIQENNEKHQHELHYQRMINETNQANKCVKETLSSKKKNSK